MNITCSSASSNLPCKLQASADRTGRGEGGHVTGLLVRPICAGVTLPFVHKSMFTTSQPPGCRQRLGSRGTLIQARHLDRNSEAGAVCMGRIVCIHAPDHRPRPAEVPWVVHLGPQLSRVTTITHSLHTFEQCLTLRDNSVHRESSAR